MVKEMSIVIIGNSQTSHCESDKCLEYYMSSWLSVRPFKSYWLYYTYTRNESAHY